MPGCSPSLGFGAGSRGFLADGAAAPCELWFLRGRHVRVSAKEPGYSAQGRPQAGPASPEVAYLLSKAHVWMKKQKSILTFEPTYESCSRSFSLPPSLPLFLSPAFPGE